MADQEQRMLDLFPNMQEALGSVPSTTIKKRKVSEEVNLGKIEKLMRWATAVPLVHKQHCWPTAVPLACFQPLS